MHFTKLAYTVSLLLVALGLAAPVLANTVILAGPDGTTLSGGLTNLVVNVPTGKVMVVTASSIRSGVTVNTGGVTWEVSPGGANMLFDTSFGPRYLAGPCTFTYSVVAGSYAPASSVFNYDVLPANGIQMLVATNAAVIQIPSGQRLRLLDGSYPLYLTVTLTNGASAKFETSPKVPNILLPDYPEYFGFCNPGGFELAAPLTVSVIGNPGTSSPCFITYFFASDVIQVVGQAIQSPVGSIVAVEKSSDLETWYPAFVTTEQHAPTAFYRLRVVR